MKLNPFVSSSRRKNRKRHFQAPSHIRRKLMCCRLSRDLQKQYNMKSIPINKGDEVDIIKGLSEATSKSINGGKVKAVYRKKFVLHLERSQREKANGQSVQVGIQPANVVITKAVETKYRKQLWAKRAKLMQEKDKYVDKDVDIANTSDVSS
ncbi:hypothetical protein SNEBB_006014 [Seison nebaliae]|nr:hypothetical protein SNEBB_006014 [Seison nebaliae]